MKRWLIGIAGLGIVFAATAIARSRLHWCSEPLPIAIHLERACRNWNESTLDATRLAGDEVIRRLEAYQLEHGAFPPSLDALRSPDSPPLPEPAAGKGGWQYSTDQLHCCFWLGVSGYRDCSCLTLHTGKDGAWQVKEAKK